MDSDLRPCVGCLVGFMGEHVKVHGYVEITSSFGDGEFVRKMQVEYLVIACKATYNVLIGRDTLDKSCAVISIGHLTVKYPPNNGKIGVLKVD